MTHLSCDTDLLLSEIHELRREVDRLTSGREERRSTGEIGTLVAVGAHQCCRSEDVTVDDRSESYVFDDDDDGAQAFDEFYRAYDEVHVKTRKFLLG